ncbi:MAG: hypothetical protein JRE16_08555 [Deltaproteobacteria bacterium]|jgi:hypothetical protein|nr:hypothetical protein [Deltaproteobacteria bacterium]MBW2477230.1 hypothetical protein [Deltaproteobacteria bacterium]MBW2504603.1 hypothetical protein [Deltaproteobacteria bacterium]MBW2519643.1 hypothetical protein [Deltaproteobacteria bacterium]
MKTLRLSLNCFALLLITLFHNQFPCLAEASLSGVDQFSSECLSCHEDIIDSGSSSHSGSHVVGIDYQEQSARNRMLRADYDLPPELLLPNGVVSCVTCHGSEPHEGQSLVIDNSGSALCSACHLM